MTKKGPLLIILLLLMFSLTGQTQQDTVISDSVVKVVRAIETVLPADTVIIQSDTTKTADEELLKPPQIGDIISVSKIIWSLIFFFFGYLIIRIITKLLGNWAEKGTKYRITIKSMIPVVRIAGWSIIIFIIIAGIIKPPMATVIAVTASVGIAVGFAAQDILKNIFSGIMILLDKPFLVGDKIEVGKHYGEVILIGLRSTRIVTPDDSMVTIPNGEIMNQSVSNSNVGEPNCQVVAEIFLPDNINTEMVRSIAIEAAQTSQYIFLNKPIKVLFFHELREKEVYLKMRLKAYVMDIRFEFDFKSDMTEKVIRKLHEEGMV